MHKYFASALAGALLLGGVTATPALAQNRDDQASARKEMKAGRNMPLREIEQRIIPRMKGNEYLGSEYDGAAAAYRLKFIRDGKVTWVDVDARSGRVLRVSK